MVSLFVRCQWFETKYHISSLDLQYFFGIGLCLLIEFLILVVEGDFRIAHEVPYPLASKPQLEPLESSFHGGVSLQDQLQVWNYNTRLDPNRHFQKLHISKGRGFSPSQPQIEFPRKLTHHLLTSLNGELFRQENVQTSSLQPSPNLLSLNVREAGATERKPENDNPTSASHLDSTLTSPWITNDLQSADDSAILEQHPQSRVIRNLNYWNHNPDFSVPSFPFEHVPDYPKSTAPSNRQVSKRLPGLEGPRNIVNLRSLGWPSQAPIGPTTYHLPHQVLSLKSQGYNSPNEGRLIGTSRPLRNRGLRYGEKISPHLSSPSTRQGTLLSSAQPPRRNPSKLSGVRNTSPRLLSGPRLEASLPLSGTRPTNLLGESGSSHSFEYEVIDPASGSAFGHQESTEEGFTSGFYFVDLPGESFQKVSYFKPRSVTILWCDFQS